MSVCPAPINSQTHTGRRCLQSAGLPAAIIEVITAPVYDWQSAAPVLETSSAGELFIILTAGSRGKKK